MPYKITTKDGRVYRASKIEHTGPFLQMFCWDGEYRIPAGEISKIKSTEVDAIFERLLPIVVFVFVFTLVFLFLMLDI